MDSRIAVFVTACIKLSVLSTCLYGQDIQEGRRIRNEAYALKEQGRFKEALSMAASALVIFERELGLRHPATENLRVNVARLYDRNGDYTKAQKLFEQTLSGGHIDETLDENGLESDTLLALTGLANVYHLMGDHPKACELQERVLSIRKKIYIHDHERLADVLHNLAVTYLCLGDYRKALDLNQQAIKMREGIHGPDAYKTAVSYGCAGEIYAALGQYEVAREWARKALAVIQAHAPDGSGDLGLFMSDLADIHIKLNEGPEAVTLLEQALVMVEKDKGSHHRNVATILESLADAHLECDDANNALKLLQRALSIREKTLGNDHPLAARAAYSIARIYVNKQDYTKARESLLSALETQERVLGPNHPDTAATLGALAEVYYINNDLTVARSYAMRGLAARSRVLQAVLSLDERTRLSWQRDNPANHLVGMLRDEPLAELLLREKGVVLDSLLEDRLLASAIANARDGGTEVDQLASLRGKLSKISFDRDKENDAALLQEQIAQIQRSLAMRANIAGRVRRAADTGLDAIMPALASGSALVDLFRFTDSKLEGEERVSYGAIITGADGAPYSVRIKGATSIDRAIDALRNAIAQSQVDEVEAQTKILSQKLWQPIAAKIPDGTKQLIICPDDKLNFLSFGTLLENDGSFVAEKYPIAYIGSGRDLARKALGETAKNLVVFADPVFDASGIRSSPQDMVAMRAAEADVFGAINLPPLPGTKAEAEQLEVIAAGAGWDIKATTGEDATESSVREAKKPGVLHLATHGFYLNSFSPLTEDGTRGMSVVGFNEGDGKGQGKNGVDPMRASGVALTGAQETLKLWSQRKAPEPETDGILTAEEVASLDLNGTWLVTLSACETGVGEARSGEGVFGLRRAFMMAGAENLLMTLWPVADDTTASIMADFYKEALATGDAPGSLAKVQRDWLVKLREEKGLAAAIREAGPFAMVMMTAPTHHPVELPAPSSGKSSWWPF